MFIPRYNLYTIDIDKNIERNCYNCSSFVHVVRHCRNRGIEDNQKELEKKEESSIEETRQIDRTII